PPARPARRLLPFLVLLVSAPASPVAFDGFSQSTGTFLQGPAVPEQAFLQELLEAAGPDAPMLRKLGVKRCEKVRGSVGKMPIDVETYEFPTVDRAYSAFSFFLETGAKALSEGDPPGCFLQGDRVVFWSDRVVIRTTFPDRFGARLFSYVEWLHKEHPARDDAPALVLKAPRRDRWGTSSRLALTDLQGDSLFPSLAKGFWNLDRGNALYLDAYVRAGVRFRAGWVLPRTPAERSRLLAADGAPTGVAGEVLRLRACGDALAVYAGPPAPAAEREILAEQERRFAWDLKGEDPDLAGSFRQRDLTAIDLFLTGIRLIGLIVLICAGGAALVSLVRFALRRRARKRRAEADLKSPLGLS
ncbi:MAG: hypothetical protein KA419_07710, partial [Acidobacteria bacterium]|nr:hypothetical protein [Acidobacteriota bacterium]